MSVASDLAQSYGAIKAKFFPRHPPRRLPLSSPVPADPPIPPPDPAIERRRRAHAYAVIAAMTDLRAKAASFPARKTMREILAEVATKHGVGQDEIKSPRRRHDLVRARHEFFARAHDETIMSYPQIGRFCGGRDHTTVMHGVRKHMERMAAE